MSASVEPRAEYDPSHFAWIHDAEERHFWFRARGEIIASLMASLISTYPNAPDVLEVGCGSGNVLRDLAKLPRGRFFGMDLFSEGFTTARRRSPAPLLQADLHRPPFRRDFDLVCLFDVLEHIEEDVDVLVDLAKMLRPGGRLVLTVPAHPALWSYADELAHHVRRYTASGLSETITRAGLQVEYLTPFMACLLPLMSIGRLLNARRAGERPDKGEHDHLRRINQDPADGLGEINHDRHRDELRQEL